MNTLKFQLFDNLSLIFERKSFFSMEKIYIKTNDDNDTS